ncbi:MAG: family 16 glycosylhydrolase [Terracidiphilus sp.]
MRAFAAMCTGILLLDGLLSGCGGGGGGTPPPPDTPAVAPTIATTAAQNGAVIASLATTTPGATIYYTLDGSAPTNTSQIYSAPFLVASNLTVNALAGASGYLNSSVTSKSFTPNIAPGTLVWSDEFTNSTGANAQPNPATWTYDTGTDCCGNNELETYCAWGSSISSCDPANPNAYADTSGILHIVARNPSAGVYTSARMKTEGLFSFQYGRIEAHMMLPESQGMWPAFWMLGDNIVSINWPACGEADIMEHVNGSDPQNEGFDWVQGSVHGANNLSGGIQYHPAGFSAAAWHSYGMIWTKGQIQYYVDDPTIPANVYATFDASTMSGTWPFDQGPQFVIMNLAVGGDWPGAPNSTTVFPSQVQVDYVRIYTN